MWGNFDLLTSWNNEHFHLILPNCIWNWTVIQRNDIFVDVSTFRANKHPTLVYVIRKWCFVLDVPLKWLHIVTSIINHSTGYYYIGITVNDSTTKFSHKVLSKKSWLLQVTEQCNYTTTNVICWWTTFKSKKRRKSCQGRNMVRWRLGRKQVRRPMFEPEVFRKQLYCTEESTCDIVGTSAPP